MLALAALPPAEILATLTALGFITDLDPEGGVVRAVTASTGGDESGGSGRDSLTVAVPAWRSTGRYLDAP